MYVTDLKKQNQKIMDDVKRDGKSYGMRLLISAIEHAQTDKQRLIIYMKCVTPKRLSAFVIHDGALHRLCIPEAGHRLYTDYKDGYQYNGGGYSFEVALLERLHREASRHIDVKLTSQGELIHECI